MSARSTLPVLRTARLVLRPVAAGDARRLHALWSLPAVRYLEIRRCDFTRAGGR